MIGPFFYPRRRPPSRDRRSPRWERVTKGTLGWLVERLTAPFQRWDEARLLTPDVPVPVRQLSPELIGYRIALVTDLHHGPAVPAWWLAYVARRVAELEPDVVVLGGDFVSHARSDLVGLEHVIARFTAKDGVTAVLGNHDHWVDPDAVAAALQRGGATVLTNRHRLIRRGGATVRTENPQDIARDVHNAQTRKMRQQPVLLERQPDFLPKQTACGQHTNPNRQRGRTFSRVDSAQSV